MADNLDLPPSVKSRICPLKTTSRHVCLLTQMHFVFSIPVFVSTNRQIKKTVDKRICFQIASLVWSLLFEVKGIANHNINTWRHLRTTFHVNFDSYLWSTQLDKTILKEILFTRWHLEDAGPSIIIHTIDNFVLEIKVQPSSHFKNLHLSYGVYAC